MVAAIVKNQRSFVYNNGKTILGHKTQIETKFKRANS